MERVEYGNKSIGRGESVNKGRPLYSQGKVYPQQTNSYPQQAYPQTRMCPIPQKRNNPEGSHPPDASILQKILNAQNMQQKRGPGPKYPGRMGPQQATYSEQRMSNRYIDSDSEESPLYNMGGGGKGGAASTNTNMNTNTSTNINSNNNSNSNIIPPRRIPTGIGATTPVVSPQRVGVPRVPGMPPGIQPVIQQGIPPPPRIREVQTPLNQSNQNPNPSHNPNHNQSSRGRVQLVKGSIGSRRESDGRRLYTAEEKIELVRECKRLGYKETASKYDVPDKTLHSWQTKADQFGEEALCDTPENLFTSKYKDIEDILCNWCSSQIGNGSRNSFSHAELTKKAIEVSTGTGDTRFRSSPSWIKKFIKKFNIPVGEWDVDPGGEGKDVHSKDVHSKDVHSMHRESHPGNPRASLSVEGDVEGGNIGNMGMGMGTMNSNMGAMNSNMNNMKNTGCTGNMKGNISSNIHPNNTLNPTKVVGPKQEEQKRCFLFLKKASSIDLQSYGHKVLVIEVEITLPYDHSTKDFGIPFFGRRDRRGEENSGSSSSSEDTSEDFHVSILIGYTEKGVLLPPIFTLLQYNDSFPLESLQSLYEGRIIIEGEEREDKLEENITSNILSNNWLGGLGPPTQGPILLIQNSPLPTYLHLPTMKHSPHIDLFSIPPKFHSAFTFTPYILHLKANIMAKYLSTGCSFLSKSHGLLLSSIEAIIEGRKQLIRDAFAGLGGHIKFIKLTNNFCTMRKQISGLLGGRLKAGGFVLNRGKVDHGFRAGERGGERERERERERENNRGGEY